MWTTGDASILYSLQQVRYIRAILCDTVALMHEVRVEKLERRGVRVRLSTNEGGDFPCR
jgi:hypothetical protein